VPAFGFWDILIIAFVLLLIFGPKRLPQMGKSIGGGIKEFKDSVTGHFDKQDAEAEAEVEVKTPAQLPPAQLPPAQPAAPSAQPETQPDPRERDTVL
jgi:sec-independent protein translocase protein TatA